MRHIPGESPDGRIYPRGEPVLRHIPHRRRQPVRGQHAISARPSGTGFYRFITLRCDNLRVSLSTTGLCTPGAL